MKSSKKGRSWSRIKIAVENFGPLRKAEVHLDSLSIYVGRNNIGKSILSQVAYVLLRVHRDAMQSAVRRPSFFPARRGTVKAIRQIFEAKTHLKNVHPQSKEIELFEGRLEKSLVTLQKALFSQVSRSYVSALERIFPRKLQSFFGQNPSENIRVGSRKAYIHFNYEGHLFQSAASFEFMISSANL